MAREQYTPQDDEALGDAFQLAYHAEALEAEDERVRQDLLDRGLPATWLDEDED